MSLRDSSDSEISEIEEKDANVFEKEEKTTNETYRGEESESKEITSCNTVNAITLTDIKENKYLLVKFEVGKSNKYYVAKVLYVDGVSLGVKFMRKKFNNIFYWPVVDDNSVIFVQDVVKILTHSECRRGLIKIDDNIDLYLVG